MKKFSLLFLSILSLLLSFGCCAKIRTADNIKNENLIQHLSSATVMFVNEGVWGTDSYCSGFWINEDHIVTAAHCLRNKNGKRRDSLKFQTNNEFDGSYPINMNRRVYTATLIGMGEDIDVAILKSASKLDHAIARVNTGRILQGAAVHIMSHPVGLNYNYTTGIVSQIRDMNVLPSGDPGRYYVLHITTSGTNGSSGGGVFDGRGNLIGIGCFIVNEMPGAMFFLHRDLIVEVLEKYSITYY